MADGQLLGLLSPETGQQVQQFGAALGGRLPEFQKTQALQQQQQRTLSKERKQALLVDNRGVRRALEANDIGQATNILRSRLTGGAQLGADMSDTAALLEQLQSDPQGALSEVVRLDNFAVDAGLLDAFPSAPERKIEEDALGIKRFVDTGEPVFADVTAEGLPKKVVVKASEILPDGTTIQSTSEGVRVFNAQGEKLEGEDVVAAIESANELGIRLAGDKAAATAAAAEVTQKIKVIGNMFAKLPGIQQSLLTIGKARAAIAEGAETGVIDKLLPDIRESTVKLTNLMNQLGLEVVSGATFGALSAGELRLALDTALPTGLQPEALDRWLVDKGNAQQKLLTELQNDIISLGEPGTTLASLVLRRRNAQQISRDQEEAAVTPASVPPPVVQQPAATGEIKFLGFE